MGFFNKQPVKPAQAPKPQPAPQKEAELSTLKEEPEYEEYDETTEEKQPTEPVQATKDADPSTDMAAEEQTEELAADEEEIDTSLPATRAEVIQFAQEIDARVTKIESFMARRFL